MLTDKSLYIARHAETVYNRSARMQGWMAHTPLTANGMRQADAMGEALKSESLSAEPFVFWCSTAGRTRQTAAAIADHLNFNYFDIRFDDRLQEINVGDWEGEYYADIQARQGEIVDRTRRVFSQRPPNGEWYSDVAARLSDWASDVAQMADKTHLVISHGLASRVLRGLLAPDPPYEDLGAPVAQDVPQGHIVHRVNGAERLIAAKGPPSQKQAY